MTGAARLRLWGVASLLLHAALWLALLLGPGLVGRKLAEAPLEPAIVEVVLGEGGETVRPEKDEEASPSPEPPVPPQPEQKEEPVAEAAPPPQPEQPPPPEEPEETAPPLPPLPPLPPPPVVAPAPELPPAPPLPRIALPSAPPPRAGAPPAVRLGDAGKPPHADLLDPESNRFRAATQDNGNRMPGYPLEAARKLEAGTVKLQLLVDTTGRVANALVVKSSGSAVLDRAAREQALTWKFTPAKRDGKLVQDIVEIEIEFKLI